MNGDGPTNTGSNNSFSRPTKIETDVGCVDPNSVVNTPEGLMFKSQKGIYLLSRSLTVQYIGADVEDFNQYKIKSALFLENNNQVRFTTNNGYILVYDFFFKQWSVFTYGGIDSEYVTNQFYTLQSSPVAVLRESAAFADGSSYIKMLGVTPWIKLAGIQGYQRIRRMSFLGESKGAHNMQISVGYDYDNSTFTPLTLVSQASTTSKYQFMGHIPMQKCEAIRFKFEDSTSGSVNEGYTISDLSIEVGVKRGIKKQAAANQVG